MVGNEGENQEEGSEVPTTPAQEQGEEIWLHHFGEVRKMGPGGVVAAIVRGPGVYLELEYILPQQPAFHS